MKNLNKLTRGQLKVIVGNGPINRDLETADPVTCHYHYTGDSGNPTITYNGQGDCHDRGDGSKCYTYTSMGGSCYE